MPGNNLIGAPKFPFINWKDGMCGKRGQEDVGKEIPMTEECEQNDATQLMEINIFCF